MQYRFAIMLLGLAVWFGGAQVSATDKTAAADGNSEVHSQPAQSAAGDLPADAQSSISAALGREDDSYEISARAGHTKAENAQNQLNMFFKTDGVHIRLGAAKLRVTFAGYGYGDAVSAAR